MSAADVIDRADARSRSLSFGIMGAGMIWLALVAWFLTMRSPYPFHGYEIYDLYYFAILEGRLDLPPRTIRFEGWYTADGTSFPYNGVAPLLTRFVLGWVWPFETFSMSGPSIWFWAVVGTIGYHVALTSLASRAGLRERRHNAVLCLCAGLWLAGPALLLIANRSFYHEPIAVTFGMTGLFVAVWVRWACERITLAKAVALMGLLAAIAFHGRPNLAIALYAATALAICWGLWRHRAAFLLPAMISGALLGAGIGGYLALNEARLGSIAGVDGNYERVYGFRFWGTEDSNSERAEAFETYGRFNVLRVLPNLALYITDVPTTGASAAVTTVSDMIYDTYRNVTEPILGFIRIEHPRVGMLIMWPVWLYLSLIGLWALRRDPPIAVLAGCMMLAFGLTLAYGTVTLRYRLDLWPLLGLLALVGAVRVLASSRTRLQQGIIAVLLGIGGVGSLGASVQYQGMFRDDPDHPHLRPWTYEVCADLAQAKGFDGDDLARICRTPALSGA